MKIYRNGTEIELTQQEITAAWLEHQAKLDKGEKEGIKEIIADKLHESKLDYDLEDEDDIVEEMTDLIWTDVKHRGVDMDWALGTEEYCGEDGGFSEYFYEALDNLELT